MHDDAEAHGRVETGVRKVERMDVANREVNRRALRGRALPGDGQHLARCVDGGDRRSAARQQQRRPSGSRADVEDRAVPNRSDERRHRARLRVRHELSDGTAEPPRVEGPRGLGIGVGRIAIVVGTRRHATSLPGTASGGG